MPDPEDEPGHYIAIPSDSPHRPRGTKAMSWDAYVRQADPEFDAARRKQVEYEFTTRTFSADPAKRGAYAPEE